MTVPVSDLQGVNPSSIIELFQLEYDEIIHHKEWVASEEVTVGTVRRSSVRRGFVIECTIAGTTSANAQPDFWYEEFSTHRDIATYDQDKNPYVVKNGSSSWKVIRITKYYFHSGSNDLTQVITDSDGNKTILNQGAIQFDAFTYQILPIEASGFEYKAAQAGSLPRPSIRASNLFSTISAILADVNQVVLGNDLTGAKLTRIRTLLKFIDSANFTTIDVFGSEDDNSFLTEDGFSLSFESGQNPHGEPDSTQQFPKEIYFVDRKVAENRDTVEFEMVSVFDLAGVVIPKRQVLPSSFPTVGSFKQ